MIDSSDLMAKPLNGLSTICVVDLVSGDNDKRYEPAGLMAAAIIEIMQENGDCLPQDLNAKGFTPDAVTKHWHLAKSLAAIEINLMRERPAKPKSILRRK